MRCDSVFLLNVTDMCVFNSDNQKQSDLFSSPKYIYLAIRLQSLAQMNEIQDLLESY